jgi:hypothetical protein
MDALTFNPPNVTATHTCGWLIESTHVFSLLLCTNVFSERNSTCLAHPASPPSAASLGSGVSKLGTKRTASALVRLGGAVHSWTWARRALVLYRQSPHRRQAAGGFRRLSAVSFAGDRAGDHRPHRQPPSHAPRRNPPACPDDESRSRCSRRCTPGSPTRPSPPVAGRMELGELVLIWGHGRAPTFRQVRVHAATRSSSRPPRITRPCISPLAPLPCSPPPPLSCPPSGPSPPPVYSRTGGRHCSLGRHPGMRGRGRRRRQPKFLVAHCNSIQRQKSFCYFLYQSIAVTYEL